MGREAQARRVAGGSGILRPATGDDANFHDHVGTVDVVGFVYEITAEERVDAAGPFLALRFWYRPRNPARAT